MLYPEQQRNSATALRQGHTAFRFPADNPAHPPTYLVHPTQIYDALLNFTLYLGLAWLFRRRKFDGQVFAVYLMCYAVTRSRRP